jgi:hypothetical protein
VRVRLWRLVSAKSLAARSSGITRSPPPRGRSRGLSHSLRPVEVNRPLLELTVQESVTFDLARTMGN